jgi:hypothetical protein
LIEPSPSIFAFEFPALGIALLLEALEIPIFFPASAALGLAAVGRFGASLCAKAKLEKERKASKNRILVMR